MEEVRGESIKVTFFSLVVSAGVAKGSLLKLITSLDSLERMLEVRGSNRENAPGKSGSGSALASISLLYTVVCGQLLNFWKSSMCQIY